MGKYADNTGGVSMVDQENVMSKVIKDLASKIGKNVFTGNISGLRGISSPAYVHSSMSYLDTTIYEATCYEYYIRRAIAEDAEPMKTLQYLVCARLANVSVGVSQIGTRQPLNPILGETSTFISESGMRMYTEQTSHHPPITHFLCLGPEDCPFEYSGYFEHNAQFYKTMTGITFTQPGKQSMKLPNGGMYTIEPEKKEITGILTTSKKLVLAGNLIITDVVNKLKAVVSFDVNEPKRRGFLGGWMGGIGGGHDKLKEGEISANREDLLEINILKAPGTSDKDIISKGSGSYLENITFVNDEKHTWDINMPCKTEFKKPTKEGESGWHILPSDSSCRDDGAAINAKNWEEAEAKKHEMEQLQRHDAKLRKESEAKRTVEKKA